MSSIEPSFLALQKIVAKAEADPKQIIRLTDIREILEDTCGTEGIIEDLPDDNGD